MDIHLILPINLHVCSAVLIFLAKRKRRYGNFYIVFFIVIVCSVDVNKKETESRLVLKLKTKN